MHTHDDILRPDAPATVLYVMDAYCGWCWGFAQRMGELEVSNRHRVAFTAISGGLFTGARAAPIGHYPHIPQANERITSLTGARFSPAYQALLRDGSTVLDSLDAAAIVATLRAQAPGRAVYWAHAVQAAFYSEGRSLSNPDTLTTIARKYGLDVQRALQQWNNGQAHSMAAADIELARHRLGVQSFPTLLLVKAGHIHQLPATGATLSELNQALNALLPG